jgi:hypothetical protein
MAGDKDASGAPLAAGPRCRCGHDRRHPLVRPEYRYGGWGLMVLGLFGSPTPARIDYVCTDCGELIESLTDHLTLSRFRHREPLPYER